MKRYDTLHPFFVHSIPNFNFRCCVEKESKPKFVKTV